MLKHSEHLTVNSVIITLTRKLESKDVIVLLIGSKKIKVKLISPDYLVLQVLQWQCLLHNPNICTSPLLLLLTDQEGHQLPHLFQSVSCFKENCFNKIAYLQRINNCQQKIFIFKYIIKWLQKETLLQRYYTERPYLIIIYFRFQFILKTCQNLYFSYSADTLQSLFTELCLM